MIGNTNAFILRR